MTSRKGLIRHAGRDKRLNHHVVGHHHLEMPCRKHDGCLFNGDAWGSRRTSASSGNPPRNCLHRVSDPRFKRMASCCPIGQMIQLRASPMLGVGTFRALLRYLSQSRSPRQRSTSEYGRLLPGEKPTTKLR